MIVNPKLVSQLREQTGAGIIECKNALEESGSNLEKAIEILRKRGEIKAAKKSAERTTKEGLIHAYIHGGGKVGVMIEVSCETDFVARNEEFRTLVHDLAMQVAAANPLYVRPEDVPEEVKDKEKEMYLEEIRGQEKPPAVAGKILEGKMQKYFEDVCLLKQPFIKDEDISVEELINQKIAKIGEKIEVKKFVRYQIA